MAHRIKSQKDNQGLIAKICNSFAARAAHDLGIMGADAKFIAKKTKNKLTPDSIKKEIAGTKSELASEGAYIASSLYSVIAGSAKAAVITGQTVKKAAKVTSQEFKEAKHRRKVRKSNQRFLQNLGR